MISHDSDKHSQGTSAARYAVVRREFAGACTDTVQLHLYWHASMTTKPSNVWPAPGLTSRTLRRDEDLSSPRVHTMTAAVTSAHPIPLRFRLPPVSRVFPVHRLNASPKRARVREYEPRDPVCVSFRSPNTASRAPAAEEAGSDCIVVPSSSDPAASVRATHVERGEIRSTVGIAPRSSAASNHVTR